MKLSLGIWLHGGKVKNPIPPLDPPSIVSNPYTSGSAIVGQQLTGHDGTWSGSPVITYSRSWYRGTVLISGANGSTYTVTDADFGHGIRFRVVATNDAGSISSTSNLTATVAAPNFNWQPFNMLADTSGDWVGFSAGIVPVPPYSTAIGIIDAEPTAVTELAALFQDASGDIVAAFMGDWRNCLAEVGLSFDGQALTPSGYSLQNGCTFLRFSGYTGTVAVGNQYAVLFG